MMGLRRSTTSRTAAATAAAVALIVVACSGDDGDSVEPDAAAADPGESESGPSGSLTLTIWGGENDKAVWDERLALAGDALPGIEVDLIQIPEDYDTKVQTMFAGGEAPDVLMIAEAINVYSGAGRLEDLRPYYADAGLDPEELFGEGSVATYSTGDSLWGAPDRGGAMVLYYNKDIFDAQGVDYPDGSWDWDAFRSAASALTERDGDAVEHWGYAAGDWWPWYMTFMYQNGGRVLDDNGTPVADSPENVEAIDFYNSIVYADGSAPSPIDYANEGLNNGQPDPLFAQGRLAMVATGFWNVGGLADSDLNWDIAPLWHGQEHAIPAFGSSLAMASDSDQKEAAFELIRFLTSPAGQKPIIDHALDVPSNLELLESADFQSPSWNTGGVNLAAFTESAGAIYSPPLVPEWNEIQGAFSDGLSAVWMGEQPAADGLARVQQELERIFR